MKRKDYWIDIISLKNGEHHYVFDIENTFFDFFENSLIEKGNLRISITLEKNERLIRSHFEIQGNVELICDRSLKSFDYQMIAKENHLFKFIDDLSEVEDTEEISHIDFKTEKIDLGQLIYEYIGINIPMKKIHPDHLNDGDDEGFIYQTEESAESKEEENKTNEDIDPRWEALKKLNKK